MCYIIQVEFRKGCDAMTLIVCLDDNNGMMFNNRRQSRDSKLNERIMQMAHGTILCISDYSKSLFPMGFVSPDFLVRGTYFIEDPALLTQEIVDSFDMIIVCKWNRDYPADKFFNFSLQCYELNFVDEMEGSSHEKITIETFLRREI